MIKKTLIILLILVFTTIVNASAKYNDEIYSDILAESNKYNDSQNSLDIENTNPYEKLAYFFDICKNEILNLFADFFDVFVIIISIGIISSILKTMVTSDTVADFASFSCSIVCALLFSNEFRKISNIGIDAIRNLCDYMNITYPGYAALMASSGYAAGANMMSNIFIVISNIISVFINKIIVPVVFSCGILALSNSVSSVLEIDKMINLVIKSLKYIVGFITIIFSTFIGFLGFTTSAVDGIAVKTAKYAVSNFVPVVGGCLSESINSIVYSSVLMKNTIGIIGFTTILLICIVPIIRTFIMSFALKLLSYLTSILLHANLSKMFDTISEIVSFISSMLVFVTAIFILIIGVVVSAGV